MARRLPPLNALRVFEAAARHLSFTRAAAELNVTQTAVSHQIKALEEHLRMPLFRRLNRSLVLTEAGQSYLPPLRDAFDQIAEATARLRTNDAAGTLTVSTLASFAAKWLVPRLPCFHAAHPAIDVLISTPSALVDFSPREVAVAMRFGRGGWPGLRAEKLLTEDVFPVCAPVLADGRPAPRTLEDLRCITLLRDDFMIDWPAWLAVAGASGVDAARGPRFTDSALVIQCAVEGQGVALARTALAARDLAAGHLVRPFDIALPSDAAYYIVAPPRFFDRPKVAA